MDSIGIRIVTDPTPGLLALSFIAGGIVLGTISGLLPGLHVNTLAILLATVSSTVPGAPHLIGAAMIAAGVVHSFLDIVPALAIGVPDAAMAVSALPGHRLVLSGRGHEALRISAFGSGGAVLTALVLGLPVTLLMERLAPILIDHIGLVLGVVTTVLIATESDALAKLGGIVSVLSSGALGFLTLDIHAQGLIQGGDVLLPLLSGLFGIPILIHAARGQGPPPQTGSTLAMTPLRLVLWSFVGAFSGAIVAYIPGVSAAVAATMAFVVVPTHTGSRSFIAAVSGVNTANTVFALYALLALGAPRTGVLVAFERAKLPPNLPLLLATILIAAAVAFVLVPVLGDRYLMAVERIDNTRLSIGVLVLLVVLVGVFTGRTGIAILGVATLVGLVPMYFQSRRVHLMGVLFVPIVV
ncbi:MAG: tripartite tricarboxylate transporter permease [Halodesulfurarchaeum sp.]